MEALGEEVAFAISGLKSLVGDVQLIARRRQERKIQFNERITEFTPDVETTNFFVRRTGAASTRYLSFEHLDIDRIAAELKSAEIHSQPVLSSQLPKVRARTSGLDLRLHRHLSDDANFLDLAESIRDNILHESERVPGLESLTGRLCLWNALTVIGDSENVIGALQGAVDGSVMFNGLYGEQLTQVHAPESFLPIALFGARCWQRNGALPTIEISEEEAPRIILHPRALEAAIRAVGLNRLRDTLKMNTCSIDCDNLFLVDDPTIEGLWTARDFDDLGNTTFRQPLIVRGQSARRSIRADSVGQSWFDADRYTKCTEEPHINFSGILVGRGENTLQDIFNSHQTSLLISEWKVHEDPMQALGFQAQVSQGIVMRGDHAIGVIAPRSMTLSGTLFGGENSLFGGAVLSRELQDTGSAVAPFASTAMRL